LAAFFAKLAENICSANGSSLAIYQSSQAYDKINLSNT